jgi:hypothetical protein
MIPFVLLDLFIFLIIYLLRYFKSEDYALNGGLDNPTAAVLNTQFLKSTASQQQQPQQPPFNSTMLFYGLLNNVNPNLTSPLSGAGNSSCNNSSANLIKQLLNSNSSAGTVPDISMLNAPNMNNMLETILNEVDTSVASKETSERLRNMITSMYFQFSDKLNEQVYVKGKSTSEFEDVRL